MDSPSPQLSFVTASCASSVSGSSASGSRRRRPYPKSAYPPMPPPTPPPPPPGEDDDDDSTQPQDIRQLLWPDERMPYYGRNGTFMGTINARIRSRPTTPTARRTQRRYALAILESLPFDGRDPQWRDGVGGAAAAGLWDTGDDAYPEEGLAVQLRQYGEMFAYLSRLYENALHRPNQLMRAEQIVRRGREILAAVRLLAGQPRRNYPPAGGTDPRNTSEVSVWGWVPRRETELAERVSERRRLRAAEARANAREEKTLSRRGPPAAWKASVGGDDGDDGGGSGGDDGGEESEGRPMTWAEEELVRSRRRRAKSVAAATLGQSDSVTLPALYGGGDDARPRRPVPIHWTSPDCSGGWDTPAPLDHAYATAKTPSGDRFLRTPPAKAPADGLRIPSYRQPPSEPVSPKMEPVTSPITTEESSSNYTTTDSEQVLRDAGHSPITTPSATDQPLSSSNSVGSGNPRLRKFRAAFKSVFPSGQRRLPWASKRGAGATAEPPPASAGVPRRGEQEEEPAKVAEITLRSNRTTTLERIDSLSGTDRSEDEKLTRTEREYQEIVDALHGLRREMMIERSERRRSRSRGRRLERGRAVSRSQSKETVKWWLGDVHLAEAP